MERLHKDLRELLALFSSNDVEFIVVGGGRPQDLVDADFIERLPG